MATSSASPRRHELDALRVLATLLLIVFHTGMAFTAFDTWHIQNLQRSETIGYLNRFLGRWHMPLFFLLAGMSAWYALGSRSRRSFAGERTRRLFIPLIFGVLVIVPPQVYIERIATWVPTRLSPINFSGSFWAWYPRTFQCCYPEGNLSPHHLWFLEYLFAYSLLLLPLLWWLGREQGRRNLARVTGFLARGWNLLLPAAWVSVAEVALRATFPDNHDLLTDMANHANFLFIFLVGFVLVSDDRLDAATRRVWKGALGLGLAAAVTMTMLDVGYVANRLTQGIAEWFTLIGLIGLGRRFLNRRIAWISRFSKISLPFYVWHQTVIVVLAYWVLRWNASIGVKYAALAFGSLAITWALAEAVRYTPPTRAAFGLPRK